MLLLADVAVVDYLSIQSVSLLQYRVRFSYLYILIYLKQTSKSFDQFIWTGICLLPNGKP